MFEMKDSGQRESFAGGAVRDVREGKGRFDLITPIGIRRIMAMPNLDWWAEHMDDHLVNVHGLITSYIEGYQDQDYLALAARDLMGAIHVGASEHRAWVGVRLPKLSPIGLTRLAIVYEKGAQKYHDRNWEKGMPIGRILDSALRHLTQAREGLNDEDHLGHALWNVTAAMHIEEMIERGNLSEEFYDLPNYLPAESPKKAA